MKVCVVGLWHLGSVTAACLASGGHYVTALDFDEKIVTNLKNGQSPLFEPELDDLLKKGITEKMLDITTDVRQAISGARVIWVTYDTPVDEDDHPDVNSVIKNISRLFPYFETGQQVLVSSQLPVGSTYRLETRLAKMRPDISISFSYSPENLRLGKAISVFTQPDRVVIGVRNNESKKVLAELLIPFTDRIEWMSVESAEMTKHALNAFLATSITFINEIAAICEQVGADAKEVERGLKSEARIGPKAYLGPGGAFAGGTLARDVAFLTQLGMQYNVPVQLFPAIKASNDNHKNWVCRHLDQLLGGVKNKTIAIWGLTYKPGTDTLRRSSAIELCKWLLEQGANVQAHDPVIRNLSEEFNQIKLCAVAIETAQSADALVVATEWADFRDVDINAVLSVMKTPLILDANRFLAKNVDGLVGVDYVAVGKAIK